jgi:hypothetical protein
LNHYFLAHENFIPLILIKSNRFTPIMPRPPLNHALLAVVIGLTFLAFLCTLCNTIYTNYFTTPAHPTSVTIPPSFQPRTTPVLLFGCQRPPLAPNIAYSTARNAGRPLTIIPQTLLCCHGHPWPYYLATNKCYRLPKPQL